MRYLTSVVRLHISARWCKVLYWAYFAVWPSHLAAYYESYLTSMSFVVQNGSTMVMIAVDADASLEKVLIIAAYASAIDKVHHFLFDIEV